MTDTELLSSASSLDAIMDSITRFYCGTATTLIPTEIHAWKVVRTSDGKHLDGVRVVRKSGRIRFEMVDPRR